MKKYIVILFAALLSASCGNEVKDPVREAVKDKIFSANPNLQNFTFTTFDKVKDVTLAEELSRRKAVFVTKEKVHAKKAAEYTAAKMKKNAAKNEALRQEAADVLKRIEDYSIAHAAQMDSVIYSIYGFGGSGKTADGSKILSEGQYVTVSPDGRVYKLQPAGTKAETGMGIAIPGYVENIIGTAGQAEQE